MREVEFGHATDDQGMMSFRVHLPLARGRAFGKAAADGQMGCIMKIYRDWQLSGDDADLRRLWPAVRRALEFCWIPGGWDADRDGVMEGCQHNTMDVEYYGPNPQMGLWYLGALRAAEEMARHVGDADFARTCHSTLRARPRLDRREPVQRRVLRAPGAAAVERGGRRAEPARGHGREGPDQARVPARRRAAWSISSSASTWPASVGLGYLVDPAHARTTLQSILKYNLRGDMHAHFNHMRVFAMADEAALLMASYPKGRPENPFPYFTEVMTGFEYAAAVGMLYEGLEAEGLTCIGMIRARYDGLRRNPFDEAECGHHYARAMASWAAILALTGFHYSAVTGRMIIAPRPGRFPWSTGRAMGEYSVTRTGQDLNVMLRVHEGTVDVEMLEVEGRATFPQGSREAVHGRRIVRLHDARSARRLIGRQPARPGRPAIMRACHTPSTARRRPPPCGARS